jgi:hypothetical protein
MPQSRKTGKLTHDVPAVKIRPMPDERREILLVNKIRKILSG